MWVLTVRGFYSVVEHREDPSLLLVRARQLQDMKALRRLVPGLVVEYDDWADYPHRAVVTRERWAAAVAQLTMEIDYDNFKNAVEDRQGKRRADVYHRVWWQLLALTRRRRTERERWLW